MRKLFVFIFLICPLFSLEQLIEREQDLQFFGCHAISQRVRIFQDILRVVFEEINQKELREDFQFLRVPGPAYDFTSKEAFFALFNRSEPNDRHTLADSCQTTWEQILALANALDYFHDNLIMPEELHNRAKHHPDLFRYLLPIYDRRAEHQRLLLSVNTSLFAFLHISSESSYSIFLNNASIAGGDAHIEEELLHYFKKMHLPTKLVRQLIAIGEEELSSLSTGCVLQLFDDPKIISCYAYASLPFGIPTSLSLEEAYRKPLQLRLLLTNDYALNPSSTLRILRYDPLPKQRADHLLNRMHELIRNSFSYP